MFALSSELRLTTNCLFWFFSFSVIHVMMVLSVDKEFPIQRVLSRFGFVSVAGEFFWEY